MVSVTTLLTIEMIKSHTDIQSTKSGKADNARAPRSHHGGNVPNAGLHHAAIEIVGPWLLNKGDELMLRAMIERLGHRFVLGTSVDQKINGQQDVPVLPRVKWQPGAEDFRAALHQKSWRECISVARRAALLPLMSRSMLRSRNLIKGPDLVALLDCSGFAYGDQWTLRRPKMRADYYTKLRQRGVKLIMLPQALGPFTSSESRAVIRRMLDQFDLIFPREPVSQQHVESIRAKSRSTRTSRTFLKGARPPVPTIGRAA